MITENIKVVEEWFQAAWTVKGYCPNTLRKLAADNIEFYYPLQGAKKGIDEIIACHDMYRRSIPDMDFAVVGDVIAQEKYVVGKWIGGGTLSGVALDSGKFGVVPANSGKKICYTGITIFVVENGKIVEEKGEEQALDVLLALGLVKPVA
ncbi:MAG: ester cyclase [Deltaproteobacteria bacterium]|jgi:predicted ester cyclase|nr:ester cyclase [Deltaproteobacteria bacterium]